MRNPRLPCVLGAVVLSLTWGWAGDTDPRPHPPEGMVLIPGGEFEMGIDEEDLHRLLELGSVPHMSLSHAL